MVSTAVLLTVVLTAFGLIAGAFYVQVQTLGGGITDLGARITDLGTHLGARIDSVDRRLEAQGASLAEVRDRLAALEHDG